MATTTETTRPANGKGPLNGARQPQAAPARSALKRRRQVPWVVAGVFLVVGCGLAFGVASLRLASLAALAGRRRDRGNRSCRRR